MSKIDPTDPEFKQGHIQIICPPQAAEGKNLSIVGMMQADLEAESGLCLIDPSGDIIRKLFKFTEPSLLRDVLQPDPTRPDWLSAIDFARIMDTGQAVLFDLSSQRRPGTSIRQSADAIVSNLLTEARQRTPESDLFFLYIDGLLARSRDLTYILEQGYKFSLDLILAHESLHELKTVGEDVYKSVMANTPTKHVFNFDQLAPEDKEILAKYDITRMHW